MCRGSADAHNAESCRDQAYPLKAVDRDGQQVAGSESSRGLQEAALHVPALPPGDGGRIDAGQSGQADGGSSSLPRNPTGDCHEKFNASAVHREPWNKGKIVGQKAPFKLKDIGALRIRLQMEGRVRELALFNLGIDSKLRSCDLVALKIHDICYGAMWLPAIVMQHKTQRPVQFEITPATRDAVQAWINLAALKSDDFLFPSRIHESRHLGTRQFARILGGWVHVLGLDPADYGTHSMRRTKATLIYRRTKNLRAVQLLLGHSKLESTVRYLGIEVDDALEISEQTEIRGR